MPNKKLELPTPQQTEVEFVVPDPEDTLFTTYANNIALGWTHFDVRMVFGEIIDTKPNKVVVEQRAQVTVSYLQAKLLMIILSQAISQHEAVFGEVKLPADAGFTNTNVTANIPPGSSARS